MNYKLKKIMKVILPAVPFILLTGCNDSAEKRVENAESLIVQGKDFKGASKSLEEALIEYPDNNNIKNLNNLMAKASRTPEEEQRFEEIKKTILGASTISSNVYQDSEGIFRIGSQHYLVTLEKELFSKCIKIRRLKKSRDRFISYKEEVVINYFIAAFFNL